MHGDLEQRSRAYILQKFRDKNSKSILVATDVASRGLDVEDIDVIVQFRVRHVDSFVHRTGRTGRANKEGTNIVLCSKQELPFMKSCEESLNISITYQNSLEASAENQSLLL